ncbi:MAG: hypothetical protein FJ255_03495 [Phycisphaerae bacterium]|nr:hypothetical protein [Phycisphaerae bacterium]
MVALYTLTIFLSAALLFVVQPLVAKLVLPQAGGSPAVWTTSMLFFQALLLAGYGYAHLLSRRLPLGVQVVTHAALLGLACLALPIELRGGSPDPSADPRGWLLSALALSVGPMFLAVSTTAPLLQRWFSRTRHARAHDPYFLYAASNAGSVLGLVAFPFVLEPSFGLSEQGRGWSVLFMALAALIVACGVASAARKGSRLSPAPEAASPSVGWRRRLWWITLAAVPSSLLLGLTQHVTSEVATLPLLWVLPLLLYLVTFILAFSTGVRVGTERLGRWAALGALLLALVMLSNATQPAAAIVAVHLLGFFVLAWMCHKRLADDRPPADRLTEFYLWLAVGGVLGGVFNALAAPSLFGTVMEYPLAIAAAVWLRPGVAWARRAWLGPALGAAGVAALMVALNAVRHRLRLAPESWEMMTVQAGFPVLLALLFLLRGAGRSFAAAVLVMVVGSAWYFQPGTLLHRERTFFGVHKVVTDSTGDWHSLLHGNTTHGLQKREGPPRLEPTTYYHRTGPIGHVIFTLMKEDRFRNAGLVGMGVGTLAAYARPQTTLTFFEIDRAVIDIATGGRHFWYISEAKGPVRGVLGDGRLSLAASEESFDLLVLDAFSADAVPTHLLTLEAFRDVYLARLAPRGLIAVHISNRYFDLFPPLARVAGELGIAAAIARDDLVSFEMEQVGKYPSTWVVMAREKADLSGLLSNPGWQPLTPAQAGDLWTDDTNSLLPLLKRDVWQLAR